MAGTQMHSVINTNEVNLFSDIPVDVKVKKGKTLISEFHFGDNTWSQIISSLQSLSHV